MKRTCQRDFRFPLLLAAGILLFPAAPLTAQDFISRIDDRVETEQIDNRIRINKLTPERADEELETESVKTKPARDTSATEEGKKQTRERDRKRKRKTKNVVAAQN